VLLGLQFNFFHILTLLKLIIRDDTPTTSKLYSGFNELFSCQSLGPQWEDVTLRGLSEKGHKWDISGKGSLQTLQYVMLTVGEKVDLVLHSQYVGP